MAYNIGSDYRFSNVPDHPARNGATLTAHASNEQKIAGKYPKALYIGGTGDVAVIHIDQTDSTPVVYQDVPVGWFPVGIRVLHTDTTATNIVGVI